MAEIFSNIRNQVLAETIIREHKNTGSENYIESSIITLKFLKEHISESDFDYLQSYFDRQKVNQFLKNEEVLKAMRRT